MLDIDGVLNPFATAAPDEAATLAKAAEDSTGEASTAYATAWTAARGAGWSHAQLEAMGYDKPPATRKTTGRRRNSDTTSTAPSDAGSDETTPGPPATAVA